MRILRYYFGTQCNTTRPLLKLLKLFCLFLGLGLVMVPGVIGATIGRLGMRTLGGWLLERSRLMVVRIDKSIDGVRPE